MKKLNRKPWQIALSAVAGVAVVGGGAAGIWYGVDQAIDNKVEEQVYSVMETATAEPAAETETETEAEKEPDTVIVYVTPSESESQSDNQIHLNPPTTFEDNTVQPYKYPYEPLPAETD